MPVFCAATGNDAIEFTKCVSGGWMTAGLCTDHRAWIFPFGRALSTIPDLPVGRVEEVVGIRDIAIGSGHLVLLTETDEVHTFGMNDYGQRGFKGTETSESSWMKLDIPTEAKVKQIACGRWNTFIVLETKAGNKNSEFQVL
jgi:alpha-tubulin suppressor-like RCC1 family protein